MSGLIKMLGFGIALGLVVLGIYFGNALLILVGFFAAGAFALFRRAPRLAVVPDLNRMQKEVEHIVLQSPPPTEEFPWHLFTGLPLPRGIDVTGAMPRHIADPFSAYRGIKVPFSSNLNVTDYLPFSNYGYNNPAEMVFLGYPINVGKIALEGSKKQIRKIRGAFTKEFQE